MPFLTTDSPALNVAGVPQLNGATVSVYDPKAMENSQRLFPTLNYSTSTIEACDRPDVVLVLTEWPELRELEPTVADTVRARAVVDGRKCPDTARWTDAGLEGSRAGAPSGGVGSSTWTTQPR